MNKTIGIIIAAVVILGGAYLISRGPAVMDTNSSVNETSSEVEQQNAQDTNKNTSSSTKVAGAKGHVIFSVADVAANMETISEVNMRISKVEMHSSASGWIVASSTPKTYDLLKLNATNESKLLVDMGAKAGTYDQVRLKIDSISIKTKSGAVREAKMPSSEMKINTKIVVSTNKVSSVNLDFLADKSLHTTGSGEFIFAPVVKIDSRSGAGVDIDTSDNTVTVIGGESDSASVVGMDIDGSVKINFQIDASQVLTIDSKNVIKIEGVLR